MSAVARLANVHRSLIYRRSEFHAAVPARAAQPQEGSTGPVISQRSLLADLDEFGSEGGPHVGQRFSDSSAVRILEARARS
ncbi:MAG: hypothetical protein ACRDP3_17595 [Streptomyces sp.]|uniref:hypothetical protein n=1 Tax=Streptomyces sp. TaxID=1931 RepID=UPI003D6A4BE4